jgi:putative hydrolase of the HAD superfamily
MSLKAVTFDFHNTLATCDRWFQHEIRTLVPAVLSRHTMASGHAIEAAILERVVQSYRRLRLDIIEHGHELDALACARLVLDDVGVHMEDASIASAIEHVMRDCLEDSIPVPGVVDTVRSLADSGIRLGVVSAAVYHPFIEWSLQKFGILDAFDVVVSSASAGYYKTRPELYLHTLDQLGVEPRESVHVGDSHRFDVEGARNAGMRTVWFASDIETGNNGAADLTVTSLTGLGPLIIERFGSNP